MRVEEVNPRCASMPLRGARSWMTGYRRRHGDETRVMNNCVGIDRPTQSGTLLHEATGEVNIKSCVKRAGLDV